jgi:RNA polymerase sigma factor (sigma-70 family)
MVVDTLSRRELLSCLERIHPRHARVLRLFYLEGQTMGEIAVELHCSRQRVGQYHSQGLLQLRPVVETVWEREA